MIYSYSLHIALQLTATLSHYGAFAFNFDESIKSPPLKIMIIQGCYQTMNTVTLNRVTLRLLSLHH
jgi:hypothetical protein